MAIIRTKRPTSFTVINNDLINDTRLDWRDLGLLTYLLSKPNNWEVSVAHLQKERKASRDAIYASMKAIITAGYATGKANPKGGFDYQVYDTPQTIPLTENPPQVNTEYLTNTDYSINTEITTTREGTILNEVQRKIFVWASTHDYWHKATFSEEEFLRALCSPKGGMRKQFENRFKEQIGGNNATHQQPAKPAKLSATEQFERAKAERDRNKPAIIEGEFIKYG